MESFFCSYPPFKPDPKNPPQANFTRLCEFRGWTSAKSLARHRRAYCQALATENSKRKDQHWPFFARFPDFDYRGDVLLERESEGVDVNAQFRRLMEFKGWEAGCSQYYKAMKEFKNAKRGTSLKPGTRAAKAIPNSSPASRQLPKPQQNLTRAPSSPPKRMKPVRVSVQVILHGPGPDEDFDNEPTPLDEFFARWWPAFKHNPTRHPINEYERMARELMWNLPTYYEWYEPFYDATREEFRHQIFRPRQLTVRKDVLVEVGTTAQQVIEMQAVVVDEQKSNQNDLALKAFNRLCLILGKDKASTREDAMESLQNVHVNIHDLIYRLRRNTTDRLHMWKSEQELGEYSYRQGIAYPWDEAGHSESSNVLRYLLRDIRVYKVPRIGRPRGCDDPDPEFDRRSK